MQRFRKPRHLRRAAFNCIREKTRPRRPAAVGTFALKGVKEHPAGDWARSESAIQARTFEASVDHWGSPREVRKAVFVMAAFFRAGLPPRSNRPLS
jgi:hypothetical protein